MYVYTNTPDYQATYEHTYQLLSYLTVYYGGPLVPTLSTLQLSRCLHRFDAGKCKGKCVSVYTHAHIAICI